MVEDSRKAEKNPDVGGDWMLVVAGVLVAPDGRWLMHERPSGKMYAGLWEFPGGKVEASENPLQSLARELREELGIALVARSCRPLLFAADDASGDRPEIVLLLYSVSAWEGEPQALEGGAIGWFTPGQALALPMPPLDRELAERLMKQPLGI